jgi:thymidylate synthase (FAD)
MSEVKLIALTIPVAERDYTSSHDMHTPEDLLAYCARVSSADQNNPKHDKLLKYCADHGHWSVFEMSDMIVEIETTRAIAAQILRHRSFTFQEFSQRYSKAEAGIELTAARRQDTKNRQNSIDDLSDDTTEWFTREQEALYKLSKRAYDKALKHGIAKECARMLLPLNTKTKLYMKGSVRSWIHYIQTRTHSSTQLEHRVIADKCKQILIEEFPIIKKVLE